MHDDSTYLTSDLVVFIDRADRLIHEINVDIVFTKLFDESREISERPTEPISFDTLSHLP